MNKNDLTNGISFKIRKGNMNYIINNKIYVNLEFKTLRNDACLEVYIKDLNDDMSSVISRDYDIMKVFDVNGKLIWERQEIDWNKIPVDTKVLVRDNDEEEWARKYFAKYKNGKFYCYSSGTTSWSNKHDSSFSYGLIEWKQCKLAEEPEKVKPHITYDYIISKHNEYCANHSTCTNCDCSGIDCYETWLIKHFDKIVQEYYSES